VAFNLISGRTLNDGVDPLLWGVHPILALLGLAGCATMPRDIQSRRYDWFDIRQAKEILIGKPPQMVVHTIGSPDSQGSRWK